MQKYSSFLKIGLLLLFFFVPYLMLAEITYYEATEYGLPIREIASARMKEFKNILILEKNGSLTIKQFLKDKKEIKRWERVDRWRGNYYETEFQNNLPVTKITVENDLIIKEELFFQGKLSEVRTFTYEKRNLSKMVVTDAEGKELYTNDYLLGANGRLTRLKQGVDNQPTFSYSYQYEENQLSRFSAQEGEYLITYNYQKGDLASTKEQKGKELLYYREEPLPGVRKTLEQDYVNNLKIDQFFNKKGLLTKKIVWDKNDKAIYEYKYDKNNHVIQENIRRRGAYENYYFTLDSKGNRKSHVYIKNGLTLRTAVYSAPSNYVETVYREKVPVFKVYYEDNIKVRSEYLLDKKKEEKVAAEKSNTEKIDEK